MSWTAKVTALMCWIIPVLLLFPHARGIISARGAADGFPFGIAVPETHTSEEREFVEARAKAAPDAKLAPKGE
jgi:hypothetical protein